jgi:hypothetical protein
MRNNEWLEHKLGTIWQTNFGDIPRSNDVKITFGRNARTRLGSIRHEKDKAGTRITLTGYFQDERVPEYLIDLTIAHELTHYAHGFFSPLPKLSKYPHQGGLVDKELAKRGFAAELKNQKKWLRENWAKLTGKSRRRKRLYSRQRTVKMFNFNFFDIF